jgi:glycerophosphoryl diester phosphodiesterase
VFHNECNKKLIDKCAKNNFLIAAHRGTVGGNILQNSFLSYKNALLHGADIVEMDVSMSVDGVFYAFHNGVEKVVFGIDKDIRKMHSSEIDKIFLYNELSLVTKKHLGKASDILPSLKDKCFINIDRSWFYWKEVLSFLGSLNMGDQIIVKSPVVDNLLKELEDSKANVMYMPIIKNKDEWEKVKTFDINVAAVELIFENTDSPLISKEFIEELKKESVLIWANAITLDDTIILSALLDDNTSIEKSFDEGWGQLIERGFNIIQTDWPALLRDYRNSRK